MASPLTLDLDGDGIETTSYQGASYFDHDGDGFAERTGWVHPDDGLLVWDRNGDGIINDGGELFGSETELRTGAVAGNGFEALAEWDDNADGQIDAADAVWSNLRVWRDLSGTDSGPEEFATLSEVGITGIPLGYASSSFVDASGNEHRQIGSFRKADGSDGTIGDVWFAADRASTLVKEWVDVPPEVGALPDVRGFGTAYDLHQAMVRETTGTLRAQVEAFIAEADSGQRGVLLEQILFRWTGAEGIDPTSRGPYMDARQLHVVEQFMGEAYVGATGPNPHHQSAPILIAAYGALRELVYSQLMAQSRLASLYGVIAYTWDEATQQVKGDLTAVQAELQTRLAADPVAGQVDLGEFARTVLGLQAEAALGYSAFREAFATQSEEYRWVMDAAGKNLIEGTAAADALTGTTAADALRGRDGDDTLTGDAGGDVLYGDAENDTLYGQAGADTLLGGDQDDQLFGGTVELPALSPPFRLAIDTAAPGLPRMAPAMRISPSHTICSPFSVLRLPPGRRVRSGDCSSPSCLSGTSMTTDFGMVSLPPIGFGQACAWRSGFRNPVLRNRICLS